MKKKFGFTIILIGLCMMAATSCQTISTTKTPATKGQLRVEYPLYDNNIDASVVKIPFDKRIKACDALCYAIVTSDAELISISISGPVDDKEFTDKHTDPALTAANFYVYSIQIVETAGGETLEQSLWIYDQEIFMTDYHLPKKGDKLFFLLKYLNDDITRSLQQNSELSDMPMASGIPVFYVTENEFVLSILNDDSMTLYDLMTKAEFEKSMLVLWDTVH